MVIYYIKYDTCFIRMKMENQNGVITLKVCRSGPLRLAITDRLNASFIVVI